ncbi:MAG: hypothetical protein KJ607_02960 [Bacteroidetes bacterium]|nr:hypothetical protein [Bacteroidota bacterium]
MKKLMYILSLSLIISAAAAQKTPDAVYLKNGSIIRGVIIENDETSVKIETSEKCTWVFRKDEIEKIETGIAVSDNFSIRSKGYLLFFDTGLLVNGDRLSLSQHLVNGYEFPFRLSAGLGTGIELVDGAKLPLFADVRYSVFPGKFSPYVYLQGGYTFPIEEDNGYYAYRGGVFLGAGIGLISYFTEHFGIVVTMGYNHQQSSSSWDSWDETSKTTMNYYYNSAALRFGFIFR